MISIIIPVYNCDKYIEECLLSIIKQKIDEKFEVICVDDGSTDKSAEIILKMSEKYHMIKYIWQENEGAPVARNKGLDQAEGEYCCFFDSDDVMMENGLEKLYNNLKLYNADIAIGNYSEINYLGRISKRVKMKQGILKIKKNIYLDKDVYLCAGLPPLPGNKMFRMSLLKNNNLQFKNLKIGQDLNIYLKIISKCKKIVFVDADVLGYRIIDGSISRQYNMKILNICECMKDVKDFYFNQKDKVNYEKYISVVELIAYRSQMSKLCYYNSEEQKYICEVLGNAVNKVNYKLSIYLIKYIKEKLKIKMYLKKYGNN